MKPELKEKYNSRKLMFAVLTWVIGTVYLLLVVPSSASEVEMFREWIGFTEFILGSYFGSNIISHGINAFGKNTNNHEEDTNYNNTA